MEYVLVALLVLHISRHGDDDYFDVKVDNRTYCNYKSPIVGICLLKSELYSVTNI
jgi:hypothetical protein